MPYMLADGREPINSLWYGDGGTGKTTDISSMAHLGRILLVNAENGIKRRALEDRGIPVENIEIFPEPGEELSYEALEALWLRVREALDKDPDAYIGVGWDSITEIQKALTEQERLKAVARADRRGQERDPFTLDQDNRTKVNDQLRSLIRKYRDLPCHFAATALMRRDQDDDGAVTYQPAVTPGVQNDLVGYMDIICVTFVAQVGGEDEYRGLFRSHGKYRGKDRLGNRTPKWLVDPTFDRVLQYVDGELEADDDVVMAAAKARRNEAAKLDVEAEAVPA